MDYLGQIQSLLNNVNISSGKNKKPNELFLGTRKNDFIVKFFKMNRKNLLKFENTNVERMMKELRRTIDEQSQEVYKFITRTKDRG